MEDPENGLKENRLDKWPFEDPSTISGSAVPRVPLPQKAFDLAFDEVNTNLIKLSMPTIMNSEFLGARMYTGPCFVKYNTVLRGLQVRSSTAHPKHTFSFPIHSLTPYPPFVWYCAVEDQILPEPLFRAVQGQQVHDDAPRDQLCGRQAFKAHRRELRLSWCIRRPLTLAVPRGQRLRRPRRCGPCIHVDDVGQRGRVDLCGVWRHGRPWCRVLDQAGYGRSRRGHWLVVAG